MTCMVVKLDPLQFFWAQYHGQLLQIKYRIYAELCVSPHASRCHYLSFVYLHSAFWRPCKLIIFLQ